MNREQYKGDARYERVLITMDLLGIMDVSTTRQARNGTVVWRLPIKNINNRKPSYIEVASFATGYVRNQNSGYSNYQLNKRCETDTQYYPESEWVDGDYKKTGKFLPFSCRGCILIPNEIDRLEYLIGYCLKNYYIKRANEVADGKYVSKWYHEYELERNQNKMGEICHINSNHEFVVNDLQNKLANSVPKWKYDEAMNLGHTQDEEVIDLKAQLSMEKNRINDLENKLATIERIARINASYR